ATVFGESAVTRPTASASAMTSPFEVHGRYRRAKAAVSRSIDRASGKDPIQKARAIWLRYPSFMPAAVLVLPKSGYQNDDFLAAARKLGLTVIAASDACHQLAEHWQSTAVTWKAHDPAGAAAEIEQ